MILCNNLIDYSAEEPVKRAPIRSRTASIEKLDESLIRSLGRQDSHPLRKEISSSHLSLDPRRIRSGSSTTLSTIETFSSTKGECHVLDNVEEVDKMIEEEKSETGGVSYCNSNDITEH